jgi:hypothetical protein
MDEMTVWALFAILPGRQRFLLPGNQIALIESCSSFRYWLSLLLRGRHR